MQPQQIQHVTVQESVKALTAKSTIIPAFEDVAKGRASVLILTLAEAGVAKALKRREPQRAQRSAFLFLCALGAFVVQGFSAFCDELLRRDDGISTLLRHYRNL